jgi:hypothetical protein
MLFEVTVVSLMLTMLMIVTLSFFHPHEANRIDNSRRIYFVKLNKAREKTIRVYGAADDRPDAAVNIYLSSASHTQALGAQPTNVSNVSEKQNLVDIYV